jgi:UDP-N-acetylglucosamine--N-acetylmuramyl-(pentapeptide) pyrophosphoryl-undecaprenol N-acetylglucosamine transferase
MTLRKPRLVFYAVNGLGLGHVTRLLAIARQVRKRIPSAEILFLTSSEADDVIAREGFAAFKVPSRTLRARAGLSSGTHARLVQTVTLNLLAAFAPHLLIVDTFPAGTLQELLPVLRWDLRKAFVFRAQKPDKAQAALLQNTLRLYDRVIVPHSEGEEAIPLPDGTDAVWTGKILIRGREDALSREQARARLGIDTDAKVLYITFGGGGDAQAAEIMERICRVASDSSEWTSLVSEPPLDFASRLRQAGVQTVRHFPVAELFPAFDAAIASAGYNTVSELLHFGIPSLFLPFERTLDDQFARAERVAASKAGLCLAAFDEAELRRNLEILANSTYRNEMSQNARRVIPDNGASRAAQALLDML